MAESNNGSTRARGKFGELLRDLRHAQNLTQADVAHRAGVSPGYVGLIETGDRGERPSLDIVKRLGQAVFATIEEMESLLVATGHLHPAEHLIPDDVTSFSDFVGLDPRLSDVQKQLLVGLYESWLGKD